MELIVTESNCTVDDFELIERKGIGHPDTLADHLAEALSCAYSQHTRGRYGAILHHNFDKVGLLGGRSFVEFGHGRLVAPIRVLINGRASTQFGTENIDVWELLTRTSAEFLLSRLPKIKSPDNLRFYNNLSSAPSPGHIETGRERSGDRSNWFSPLNLGDLRELNVKTSNDTSVGCAHWPLSATELLVLEIEERLTGSQFSKARPWLGTDIKIMACRHDRRLNLTICVPQIADHVPNVDAYRSNVAEVRSFVCDTATARLQIEHLELHLNTKDDFDRLELYLTATGSSLESGDEGLVGRGNRPNRLISMTRPYSMEGSCGKNPVYHVGKLYPLLAECIARRVFEAFGQTTHAWVVSQEGRRLDDPWLVFVRLAGPFDRDHIKRIVGSQLEELDDLTRAIVSGDVLFA